MLTAAVVRDNRVRAAFEVWKSVFTRYLILLPVAFQRIGWVNMSQAPVLMDLQERLYAQLTDHQQLEDKTETMEGHLAELQKICASRKLLVVLDGNIRSFRTSTIGLYLLTFDTVHLPC